MIEPTHHGLCDYATVASINGSKTSIIRKSRKVTVCFLVFHILLPYIPASLVSTMNSFTSLAIPSVRPLPLTRTLPAFPSSLSPT